MNTVSQQQIIGIDVSLDCRADQWQQAARWPALLALCGLNGGRLKEPEPNWVSLVEFMRRGHGWRFAPLWHHRSTFKKCAGLLLRLEDVGTGFREGFP